MGESPREDQPLQNSSGWDLAEFGAVRDEDAVFAVALAVILADGFGVGHHHRGEDRCQPFRQQIPGLGQLIPLLAFALDAIHIQHNRHAGEARPEGEEGIGAVAIEGHVRAVKQQVRGGNGGVGDGIEVFVADGGQVLEPDAAVFGLGMALPAVDRDGVAARGQADGNLLREGLESAVTGRNAPRTEEGDARGIERRLTSSS